MFLFLYRVGIHIASLWNPKAKKWVAGRKLQQSALAKNTLQPGKRIWMHCASLGEYEQGLPILETLRGQYPGYSFIITFFSPSGYEPVVQKNKNHDTYILYLPLGTKREAKAFIDLISPGLVVWIKYDYWLHYLLQIRKRGIPFLLVSAIFRQDQPFFKWYGGMHRRMLGCFTEIFVQNETSCQLLKTRGFNNCIVSGDTRFDRVAEIAGRFEPIALIEAFTGKSPCVVAGSTWKQDEEMISRYVQANPSSLKWIIAPHEINNHHLKELKELFPDCIFFSQLSTINSQFSTNILIIDNIGMLSRLYKYASLTYIGGGFGKEGVHNVLEAAVFGKPVIFGPIYYQFNEAKELIEHGGGISIQNDDDFAVRMNMLRSDEKLVQDMSAKAAAYVTLNTGASKKITHYIQEKRLLTS